MMKPQLPPDWTEILPPKITEENAVSQVDCCPPLEDKPPEGARKKSDLLTDQHIEDRIANRALRKRYADKAFWLACGCIVFGGIVILSNGLAQLILNRPVFSDTVLIAVTTGVTVNVLAAFLGVIRGLFPSDAHREKKPNLKKKK